MNKSLMFLVLILFGMWGTPSLASENTCYMTFYQTKNMKCIDILVDTLRNYKVSPEEVDSSNHSNVQSIIGFLAVIFSDYPEMRMRILHQEQSLFIKGVYVEALYRANLLKEAKTYSEANGLSELLNKYQNLPNIKSLKPSMNPSDNDLLIGAYMASGNVQHIKSILENFTSAEDNVVNDAFRTALMQSKFGPKLTPSDRENSKMLLTACEKYQCKTDMKKFMHMMTLSSAFWAVRSFAKQDEGIKKTFTDFFEKDVRLKGLIKEETTAFSNYLTLLVAYTAVKDDRNINSSLSIYEKYGSSKDAFDAMKMKN